MIRERCDDSLPEEHLFEHAVSGGDSWETAGGQSMELQVGGDDLCGHLSVRRGTGSTTATEREEESEMASEQWQWISGIVNSLNCKIVCNEVFVLTICLERCSEF